jgi:uncharacterized protein YciI
MFYCDGMYFAVIRQQGPAWDAARTMREQAQWPEHVDFINGIADEGVLVVAGPLGDGDPYRTMLIVDAGSAEEAAARLEDDPWTTFGLLETKTIDRWEVLVGEFASDTG